ncbi:hypothetical protein IL306_001755 [Fusarium sp. DS 682]|nr:hypothetical protein IL306_001755 [Fusarium sp. DS 682]
MERGSLKPSERDVLLEEFVKAWRTEITIRPEKTPEEAYKERLGVVREIWANAMRTVNSNLLGADEATLQSYRQLVDETGRQVKEIQDQWEASKDEEERKYQDVFLQKQKRMAFQFIDAVGPSLFDEVVTEWRQRMAQTSTPMQHGDDAQADTIDSLQTPGPGQEPVPTQASIQEAPKVDIPVSRVQDDEADEPNLAIHQKRRASSTAIHTSHGEKRPRLTETDNLTGGRTIEFDQVYQSGNAVKKHIIVEYNEKWYIVACEMDDKQFLKNALKGAARHLSSCSDPNSRQERGHEGAIRALGTLVLNCDENKANMNNMVARRPSYDESGQPSSRVSSTVPPRSAAPRTQRNHSCALVDPKPGDVYKAYWEPDDSFYAVIILPWETFCFDKWAITLKNVGLLKEASVATMMR